MTGNVSYIRRPALYEQGFRENAELPFGLRIAEVRQALEQVYDFLHDLNVFLVGRGYDRLEETILGNSLSGFISELVVRNLGRASETLARNTKIGGHPDLIPRGEYPCDAVLHAPLGVEVKTSIQSGGWQGHNPERSWIMVVQYSVDVSTKPVEERRPIEVLKVMAAQLVESDWSFSGRAGTSRRTPTASILKTGTAKLHANAVYEHPHYIRSLDLMAERLRRLHHQPSLFE
ncbi:MAG TPA: hypothetical protein VNV37_05880 [Solirubrobacteraceae bacterium]|nr:hypothetical protein [Solirubrobacteraceae bacterium]